MLTRSQWGATVPLVGVMTLPARGIFVHHSVSDASASLPAAMRSIERTGRIRFGRFSYSYGGHRTEGVAEGAGLTIGAHTGSFAVDGKQWNTVAFGYCLIGNYEHDQLTDQQIADFARWRAQMVTDGHLVPDHFIRPHFAVKATACPGRNTMARWNDLTTQEDDDMAAPTTVVGHDSFGQWYRVDSERATPITPDAGARLRYYGIPDVPQAFLDLELDTVDGSLRVVAR